MKLSLFILIAFLLTFLSGGCSSGGGGDDSLSFSNNVTGSSVLSVPEEDLTGATNEPHFFRIGLSNIAGTGTLTTSTITSSSTGTILGLPATISFGSLVPTGSEGNDFIAIGTFSTTLSGPGTIDVLLTYTEDSLSDSLLLRFEFPQSSSGVFFSSDIGEVPVVIPSGLGGASFSGGTPLVTEVLVPTLLGPLLDIRVLVDIEHPSIGDLVLLLTNPGGESIILSDTVILDTEDDMGIIFEDAAPALTSGFSGTGTPGNPTPFPVFAPLGTLSGGEGSVTGMFTDLDDFEGVDPAGFWTLTIIDGFAAVDGVLIEWGLDINSAGFGLPFEEE